MNAAVEVVCTYHAATKHHFHRYARSAGRLDWANQPNPFRFYEGAPRVELPLGGSWTPTPYGGLFEPPGVPHALNLAALSRFLRFSLGLSAWKMAGAARWSLRMNPSSGNLHPTECHLMLPQMDNMAAGLYHYSPYWHALEQRARLRAEVWHSLSQHLGPPGFLVALTSIFWREAWKYGERAYRYCSLDAGHALAALAIAARLNHWRLMPLNDAGDDQVSALFGLDRTAWPQHTEEEPDLSCWVCTGNLSAERPRGVPSGLIDALRPAALQGQPNPLSAHVRDWPIIREVAAAARKPATAFGAPDLSAGHLRAIPPITPPPTGVCAEAVIRRRRSGVDFDRRKTLSAAAFLAILARTLPDGGAAPFEASPAPAQANLLLFVHRVEGIAAGLYVLERAPEAREHLRSLCRPDFAWQPAHDVLPLWKLTGGDFSLQAMELSCHQEIAAHGVFTVSMLVPFRPLLEREPYAYRQLFRECGMVGQVLYLEAEAQGLRGTGIGCYFDDPVHDLLGLPDDRFQCLYHFTVGYAVEDPRLTTLSGYHHLKRQ